MNHVVAERLGLPEPLKIENTVIEDTFAEAFSMIYTRLIVTAFNQRWLDASLRELCGYGSSVIGCDAEIAVERMVSPSETDDGRLGASVLAFAFSGDALGKAIANRVGQCVMTCPTTAVFDGLSLKRYQADHAAAKDLDNPIRLPLGDQLRFFGDGHQKSKLLGQRRFWRIPVMDGEFICEDTIGAGRGIAGGNFLILAVDQESGLAAAERAIDSINPFRDVILPFPGGVVRSGSKVGSRYDFLRASTSHSFCPTLRGRADSKLPDEVNCVYEIVIDGIDFDSVSAATIAGIRAAAGEGVVSISAGNYGGELGKHHFHLHKLLTATASNSDGGSRASV